MCPKSPPNHLLLPDNVLMVKEIVHFLSKIEEIKTEALIIKYLASTTPMQARFQSGEMKEYWNNYWALKQVQWHSAPPAAWRAILPLHHAAGRDSRNALRGRKLVATSLKQPHFAPSRGGRDT